MNTATIIAILLALVAIAIAIWLLVKAYQPIAKADVTGLTDIEDIAILANTRSLNNATNIDAINEQLGVVDAATTGFSALATDPVTPAFPQTLS